MIIVRIWEGLGNQMFQYAYAKAKQMEGYAVALDMQCAYASLLDVRGSFLYRKKSIRNFNLSLPNISMKEQDEYRYLELNTILDHVKYDLARKGFWKYRIYIEKDAHYNRYSRQLRDNCYVMGWFQSEKYFAKYRDVLLNEFSLKKDMMISEELQSIMNDYVTVSLHVRRGDYIKWNMCVENEYYQKALNYVRHLYPDCYIIVFTDDVKYANEKFGSLEKAYFVTGMEKIADYEEIILMSKCNHNIIANSTFSWWGAWLNQNPEKVVVAPDKWFEGQQGLIPEEWVVLNE